MSANCFVKQCRKNRRRAEFCCVRNFNQACCDYLGSGFNNVSILFIFHARKEAFVSYNLIQYQKNLKIIFFIINCSNLLTSTIRPGFDPHSHLVVVVTILIIIPIILTPITQTTIMEVIIITEIIIIIINLITMDMIKEAGQDLMEVIMETASYQIYFHILC